MCLLKSFSHRLSDKIATKYTVIQFDYLWELSLRD